MSRKCERGLLLPEWTNCEKILEEMYIVSKGCDRIITQYLFTVTLKFDDPTYDQNFLFTWCGPETIGLVEIELYGAGHPGRYLFLYSCKNPMSFEELWQSYRCRFTSSLNNQSRSRRTCSGTVQEAFNLFDVAHPEFRLIRKYVETRNRNSLWTGDFTFNEPEML